jgi:hypothetical protein
VTTRDDRVTSRDEGVTTRDDGVTTRDDGVTTRDDGVTTPTRADLPEIVRSVADAHVALLDERLPGLLEGVHLHGSIGFGGEFFGGSDVDFVAVVSRRPTEPDIAVLRSLHAELSARWPSPAYDGFYILESDLAGSPDDVPPVPSVLIGDFSLDRKGDVKLITWRELRDHGITLHGKDIREISIWVDDAALHAATVENLDTYWRSQLDAMRSHPHEASAPWVALWVGLGAPRLVHLLATGRPTSKSGAGRWAIEAYPHHREILEEALRARERPDDPSTYAADPDRRRRDLIALTTEVVADGVALTSPPT